MKRIVLFLLTNILVMFTISIVVSVLGVNQWMTAQGIDYSTLMAFCFIWGMGGAFISLLLSRFMAKWMMGVKVLQPGRAGSYEGLVQMVHQLAKGAGMRSMPEVGIYESHDVNAFATGPSESRSLVAFSTGLLERMTQQEIEGVAAHEIAHIRNGDMVTMTLIQGVINAFVMFFARIIAFALTQSSKDEERSTASTYLVTMLLEFVFGLLGMIVVCWFSRQREFRADRGAASLAGRSSMVAGLKRLQAMYGREVGDEGSPALAAFKISGRASFLGLFSTHPPLEERIRRLELANDPRDYQGSARKA